MNPKRNCPSFSISIGMLTFSGPPNTQELDNKPRYWFFVRPLQKTSQFSS